jgi:LysR family transcriptional regulator, glycine cleavage system transcriptional activator
MPARRPVAREFVTPPLSALRALESAAHHLSFSRAADELGVTQSGVSRAIRSIEQLAGVALFERTGHGLVLTEPGRSYLKKVEALLGELETATRDLATYRASAFDLRIATLPTFATRWLVPRLRRFLARNASINLDLVARIEPFEFEGSGIDGAIHYGSDAWAGTLRDHLMDETLVPVAGPGLLPAARAPADAFGGLPLIQHSHRPTAWREWTQETGWRHPGPERGVCFEQYNMGIAAALAGVGVALLPLFMIREEIASGKLIALTEREVASRWSYFFVYPETKRTNPALQRFRTWLVRETHATPTGRKPGQSNAA